VPGSPQYNVQIRDWKTGDGVASEDFVFKTPTNAKQVALEALSGSDDLPEHFVIGGAQ
jgi:hypothetical protein